MRDRIIREKKNICFSSNLLEMTLFNYIFMPCITVIPSTMQTLFQGFYHDATLGTWFYIYIKSDDNFDQYIIVTIMPLNDIL